MPGLPTGWEVVKKGLPEGWAIVDEPDSTVQPEPEEPDTGLLERLLAIAGKAGAQGTPGYAGPGPMPQAEPQQAPPRGIVQRILDGEAQEREEAEVQAASMAGPGKKGVVPTEEEIEDDPPTRLQKAVDSFQTGSAGLVDLVGGGMIWAGLEESGRSVRQYAQSVIKNNEVKELYKEFEWSDMADPDFYLTKGVQMVPSLLTLIPLAVGGGILGGAAAGALGAGTLVTSISAAVASAVAARPLESAMEAAGTYNSMLDQGASPEQASEEAAGVFTKNMALIGMDAAQFALAFAKVPAPLRKGMAGWIRRVGPKAVGFAAGAASEGYEEVLQGYFQELGEQSLNGEVDASILKSVLLAGPEAKEAFVLGTIGGGLFQAVGTAKQALTPQETDAIIQEQIDNAPGIMQEEPAQPGEVAAKGDQVGEVVRAEAPEKPKAEAETVLTAAEKPAEPSTTAITEVKPAVPPVEAEKPAVGGVQGAEGAKEPWEMTREEYVDKFVSIVIKGIPPENMYMGYTNVKTSTAIAGYKRHRVSVQEALSEGKAVPAAVLAEYPELAPEEGAAKVTKPVEDVITEPEGAKLTGVEVANLIKDWKDTYDHPGGTAAERTKIYEKIKAHYLAKATSAQKPVHWDLVEKPEEAIESAAHDAANMAITVGISSGDNAWPATLKRVAEAAVEDKRRAVKREKEGEQREVAAEKTKEKTVERSKQVKSVSDLNLRPSAFLGNKALQGEFITDGHVAIKRSALNEKRAKRLGEESTERGRHVKQGEIKELWQGYVREAKQEGEILGYSDRSKDYPGAYREVEGPSRRAYIVNKADETDIRIFDADKIRMLQSYVGFNKIKITEGKLGVAILYKDRRAVALLMPVRGEEGVVEIDVPTARRALAGEFAEESVPKEDAPKVTWLHGKKPRGTATTADIGPDIFYEQELRQAFPEAEASPTEPLGPFAKDIEPRKDLGPDLMEAARMIAAPARYRKLRASMLGVFRKPDKIELQDIRWIRTLAHELGHAVDYRLTRFPRSVMKRFPDLGVNETKARAELKRASEYFRPLPEGAKWDRGASYMRYRAKHTELMADLTGLYMLSPKKARELAPNVTEALESAIANNGDVKTAIRAVLDPEQVEFIEKRGRETKTELPPKPEFVGTEADPQIRKEAFDTVKLTSRELEAQLLRTFAFEKRLRKSLNEKERESLTFLIERIGDPRIEGDTFEKAQGRATPEVRKMAREARYEQELNRQEANKIAQEAGDGPEWIQYIADYVPHFWVVPRKKALEYAGRWRKSTPHAKQRTFPTFADGVKLGWEPVSYDFAYLYSRAAENNFRAAVTRRFARRIKDMRTTGGEPVMVGSLDKAGPDWVKIDHPVLRHVYARKTGGGDLILGEGNAYVHPSIARPVKVLLEKPFGGSLAKFVYAVNAAGKSINVAFSFFHEFSLFESSQAVNARFLNPLRGIFIGPFEARRLGLGFKPHLTHRAGFLLAEKDIYGFVDAAKHGLAIRRSPATIDYARTFLERQLRKFEAGTRKIPALSFMTKKLRVMYEAYQRHLWDNVHSGMKLFSYNTLVAETLPDLPADVSVRQAKETIASQVNDAFGGQEFLELPAKHAGKILWEPATVKQIQILHGAMFAPDWTFSNIRVAGRPIVNFRNRIMLLKGIRYWRNMILTLAGTAIILQKMIYEIFKGDDPDLKEWTWQNEPGREWDVDITPIKRKAQKTLGIKMQERRSYAHAGKQAREVLRYFSDFPKGLLQNIGNKSSVLVRLVIEQASGHQAGSGFPMPWMDSGFQDEIEGWKRIMAQGKAAGEHFTPFSWQENNFAFSVPHRKGMSRYRASKHYKDAMMALADPSWWDKIKGKVKQGTREAALIKVFQEVDEALKANGQDEDSRRGTFNSARSNLRGRYYGKFLKAVEDQDWKAADEYAVILWNLGAVYGTTKQSAESRGKKDLWYEKAREIFISRSDLRSTLLNYDNIMGK